MTRLDSQSAAEILLRIDTAPVNSCELLDTAAQARACPTGTIELVSDDRTGLVFNRRFDPETQVFSGRYEETQAFSGHFSGYARDLAERLIATHDLRGKRIIEIGCGKGHFLVELCRLAGASGVGIDPSVRPERLGDLGDVDVAFHAERLSARHGSLPADLVICRHTLEHIARPSAFLAYVRRVFEAQRPYDFYLDVPDATRIFREGAFWDVYYEHCNYFTPRSLSAVLGDAGFAVEDMHLEYDDQFLCATARPADSAAGATAPAAASGTPPVAGIAATIEAQIAAWRAWFAARNGETVALWGGGSKAVAFLGTLDLGDEVSCAVDINPHKNGTFVPGTGHPIVAPSALVGLDPDHVVIMNPVYASEIASSLADLGLSPVLWTLGDLPLRPLGRSAPGGPA